MEQERRRTPRFPFIASAEVLREGSGSRTSARVSDLSVSGCYVDTINPLPGGTVVRVKIFTETDIFEAPARVVYSHMVFSEVQSNSQHVLENWLPAAV